MTIPIENWEPHIYRYFNEAYQTYLNNIPSVAFMNTYLDKILNLTCSKFGFIASVQIKNNKKILVSEAVSDINWRNNEITVPSNLLFDATKKSLYTYPIFHNKILITNEPQNHPWYSGEFLDSIILNTLVCIPYYFSEELIGIICLTNRSSYDTSMLKIFETMGTLTAILQISYYKSKKSTFESDNRYITSRLMEETINTIHDGIIIIDDEHNIIYINNSSSEIITKIYNKEMQCIGQQISIIFPQLEHLFSGYNKLYKNKNVQISIENENKIILSITINSLIFQNKIYNTIVIHNITDEILCDEKLKKNQDKFIAFLGHELRNPLQSLTISSHLLNHVYKNAVDDNKIEMYINVINRSCSDMKKIINDILDLSKIDAGEFCIDLDNYDIHAIIQNLIFDYSSIANEKNININYKIDSTVPKYMCTDNVRLMQILSNLLSNAIKYTNKDNPDSDINLNVFVENDCIRFDIIDKGIGIKKCEVDKLFKIFGKTSNNDYSLNSIGLGLVISQKIAKLLGGYIKVVSEFKHGSIFSLYHPMKLVEFYKSSVDSYVDIKPLKGNILIVDDNENNLSLLHSLLEHFNQIYNFKLIINTTNNGYEAIKLNKLIEYNIIFMDINMVGIDGCSTSQIIKTNGFAGHIIATTGNIYAKKENREKNDINFVSFDSIVIKPFDENQILDILLKYL